MSDRLGKVVKLPPSRCKCGHLRIDHQRGRSCGRPGCGCTTHRLEGTPLSVEELEAARERIDALLADARTAS